ncbi:MAG: patatin-like phospholipase family protein, partial [Pseudomonadota bacterium]
MPEEGSKNGEEVLQPDWQVVFRDELTALQKNGANHLPDELIDDEAARERTPPCRSPAETGDNYLTGICLSGGGIRSALVSLGAMERLAKSGILSRFDYLSTVSGGGYAGSAMSYFWAMKNKPDIKTKNPAWAKADHPFDVGNDAIDSIRRDYRKGLQAIEKRYSEDLAYADKHPRQTGTAESNTDDPTNADHNDGLSPTDRRDAAREKLFQETLGRKALLKLGTEGAWNRTEADTFAARYMSHLRTHVNYLMPKGAIDALRGGYVVARAILLNLFIWIILGAGLIELLQQVGIWINRPINVLPFALLGPVSTAENAFFGLLVLLAAILAVGFAIMMFAYSLSSYLVASETPSDETGMARSVERRALWIFSGAIGLTALVTWWISQPWGLFAAGAIVVAVLAYLFLAGSFATANDGERRNAGHKYRRRRFYERYAGKALLLLIVFSVIGL